MYEHVMCINPLNLTPRSSTHEFFTRLGFEGTFKSEFARSQGATRSFTSPMAWKHSSLASQVS